MQSSPAERYPQLDGLRALAALAVLAHHSLTDEWAEVLQLGNSGVRLFFVLSGFLITGILLRARDAMRAQRLGLGAGLRPFYARRFLRIFPLYYGALFGIALLGHPDVRQALPWHACFLTNYYLIVDPHATNVAGHLWSLAVEEHFYLLWPLIVLGLAPEKLASRLCLLIALGPLSRFVLYAALNNQTAAWITLPGCLDTLGAGAMLALLHHGGTWTGTRRRRLRLAAWLGGAVLFGVAMWAQFNHQLLVWMPLRDLALAALFFAWIDGAIDGYPGWGGWLLASPPLVYLGTISYGLYLWQGYWPYVALWLEQVWGIDLYVRTAPGWPRFASYILVTVPLATISWFCYEKPLNDLKRFFPYPSLRRPTPAATAAPDAPVVS